MEECLQDLINRLMEELGHEWSFLLGCEYKKTKSENIPDAPRMIYYASVSTYVLYEGGFKRDADKGEYSHLQILSAERHYDFVPAVNELIDKVHAYLKKS